VILGLDIGGTKTAAVLGTRQGEIRWRKQIQTNTGGGFKTGFSEITALAQEALVGSSERVDMISVSIGGPLDVLNGIIKSPPNLPGWDEIPLKSLLAERFSLPVFIEHDGNAGALAEFYFGAGRGFHNIVFLTMGTGFGAGLILDGKLYRGSNDTAGEIGHIRIAEDGPLCYGKAGSLEGFCSGTGMAKLAQSMFPSLWNASTTVSDVYDAHRRGSPEARHVFEKAGVYLGRAFAMIGDLLNPERIILGGLGMRIGDAFLPVAEAVFREESLPQVSAACKIVPAQLGEAIGDIASLCAALNQGNIIGGTTS
jgi:glucokinase